MGMTSVIKTNIVRPMVFLDELAANATKNSVSVVIYSGNDDSLVPHFGSEGKVPPLSYRIALTSVCLSGYSGKN